MKFLKAFSSFHATLVGPGLGREDTFFGLYWRQFRTLRNKLFVFDADMLWHMLNHKEPDFSLINFLKEIEENENSIILTPNQIECARLLAHLSGPDAKPEPKKVKQMFKKISKKIQTKNLYENLQVSDCQEDNPELSKLLQFLSNFSNVHIVAKGEIDIILKNSEFLRCVTAVGGHKRCGGQGDILAGLTTLYGLYGRKVEQELGDSEGVLDGLTLACLMTRLLAKKAGGMFGYAVTANLMVKELPGLVHESFGHLLED